MPWCGGPLLFRLPLVHLLPHARAAESLQPGNDAPLRIFLRRFTPGPRGMRLLQALGGAVATGLVAGSWTTQDFYAASEKHVVVPLGRRCISWRSSKDCSALVFVQYLHSCECPALRFGNLSRAMQSDVHRRRLTARVLVVGYRRQAL